MASFSGDEDDVDWGAPHSDPDPMDDGKEAKSTSNSTSLSLGRVILHLDLDCFYAQVETLRNPKLQGKPLG